MRTTPAAPADKGPDFDLELAKFSARQTEAVKLRIAPRKEANRKMAQFSSWNTVKISLGLVISKGYSFAVTNTSFYGADFAVIFST